jgi:enamidase
MSRTIIINIGCLISGSLTRPLLGADALLIEDGLIAQVGSHRELANTKCARVLDAHGTTVSPGLIDSHVHPTTGEYNARLQINNWITASLHGGVTSMVSAGEVHFPGRPLDAAGAKALAIVASKSYRNLRPGGVKVQAGSVLLAPGLTEEDFAEMAREGVRGVGEVGQGLVQSPEEAGRMVRWAQKHGMVATIHSGGPSVPGSGHMDAEAIMAIRPDVAGHINGGTTSLPLAEVERLVRETDLAMELVWIGNPRVAVETVRLLKEAGQLDRLIVATDSPGGAGFSPTGLLQALRFLSSMADIAPEQAIALATGNPARIYKLDCGLIDAGKPADLVMMDAPLGSAAHTALDAMKLGDVPGVGMVVIDGEIVVPTSIYAPSPVRQWSWVRQ